MVFMLMVRVIVGILDKLFLKNLVLVIIVFFVRVLICVCDINDELGLLKVIWLLFLMFVNIKYKL